MVAPAWASDSVATMYYTGNSFGEYEPCPTCGGHALGGLGRRAGFFARARADHPGALFMSGGYEFVSYIKRRKVDQALMQPLADAYAMLHYDVALIQPREVAAFNQGGVAPPSTFLPAQGAPWTRIFDKNGLKIGVVGFPYKEDPHAAVARELEKKVADAAQALRGTVDLVVGLSGWGERGELGFCGEFPGAVDVLLGAGPGTGYGVRAVAEGKTLWVRPPFDGRGLIQLDVLAVPQGGQWREGTEYSYSLVELNSSVREVVEVTNLFSWF